MPQRYYIGLSIPAPVSAQIVQAQQELFDPELVIPPLEPHITMLPPPAVSKLDPDKLAMRCKAVAEPFWPLRLSLTAIGSFRGRAVFIDINGGYIHNLQRRLIELLPPGAHATYFPEPSFHPHITLNQARHGRHIPASLAKDYANRLRSLLPCTIAVDHLTLYRASGPRQYTAEPI